MDAEEASFPSWPFGTELRARREAARLSVRRAANRAGISEGRWRQLENGYKSVRGKHEPVSTTPETVLKVAQSVRLAPEAALELAGFDPELYREDIRQMARGLAALIPTTGPGEIPEHATQREARTSVLTDHSVGAIRASGTSSGSAVAALGSLTATAGITADATVANPVRQLIDQVGELDLLELVQLSGAVTAAIQAKHREVEAAQAEVEAANAAVAKAHQALSTAQRGSGDVQLASEALDEAHAEAESAVRRWGRLISRNWTGEVSKNNAEH